MPSQFHNAQDAPCNTRELPCERRRNPPAWNISRILDNSNGGSFSKWAEGQGRQGSLGGRQRCSPSLSSPQGLTSLQKGSASAAGPYLEAEALGLDEGQRYALVILPGLTDKVHVLTHVLLDVFLRGRVHHCGFDL